MKLLILLLLVPFLAFSQSINPNDSLKIGNKTSSSDKGIVFETGDGASNKKLLIEKIAKKLKFDGNSFQLGDGSSSSDKELVIAGAVKKLKWNGTSSQFEFDADLKLDTKLKTDILEAVNTEISVKDLLRAELGVKFGTGSAEIRYNSGNSSLEFSNDGSVYKKVGSGSGSGSTGVNLLTNGSFEDGLVGWSNTGGALTQATYSNPSEGDSKYGQFIATTTGEYVDSSLFAIPDSMTGGCQADFKKYSTTTNNVFKIQALDSSNNVLGEQLLPTASWLKAPTVTFSCPTAGSTVKLRLISTGAGTILIDQGYIGSNQNLVESVCQGTEACEDTFSAKVSMSGVVSDENLNWINGNCTNPTTGRFTCTFVSGIFTIAPNCTVTNNSGSYGSFAIVNSNSTTELNIYIGSTPSNYPTQIVCQKAGADFAKAKPQTAVKTDQSEWFIDANIGGSSNVSLGLTNNYTSYTALPEATLDMVLNQGSASAKIPCSGTNTATGLTCSSGNEEVGVNFIPPYSGKFEVCAYFTHYVNNSTGGNIAAQFQLVQTSNSDDTVILQEGNSRIESSFRTGNTAGSAPHSLCGIFSFSDVSEKTIRLMREQSYAGTVVSNSIFCDRTAANGQRDIHITVRPLLSAYNRPILTGDQVRSVGVVNPKLFSANITSTTGAITTGSNLGGVITSCTAANPTVCSFSGLSFAPNCSTSPVDSSTRKIAQIQFKSSSSITILTHASDTGTSSANLNFDLVCIGY